MTYSTDEIVHYVTGWLSCGDDHSERDAGSAVRNAAAQIDDPEDGIEAVIRRHRQATEQACP